MNARRSIVSGAAALLDSLRVGERLEANDVAVPRRLAVRLPEMLNAAFDTALEPCGSLLVAHGATTAPRVAAFTRAVSAPIGCPSNPVG